MEGFIVPSKFYGILAAGKPTIFVGDPNGELAVEINRIKCGESVKIGDSEALVKLIISYSKNITLTKKIGHKGRKAFEKSYDIDISATKFVKLLKDKNLF